MQVKISTELIGEQFFLSTIFACFNFLELLDICVNNYILYILIIFLH